MISRPTHWRATATGRESVAGAGSHASLERLVTKGDTTGRTTSRPPHTREEIELIAFRCRMTVDAVRRCIALGLLEQIDGR